MLRSLQLAWLLTVLPLCWSIMQAEEECAETDEQLRHYLRHILQARRELDQLDVSNRRTYKELVETSSWHMLAQVALQGAQGSHVGRAYG